MGVPCFEPGVVGLVDVNNTIADEHTAEPYAEVVRGSHQGSKLHGKMPRVTFARDVNFPATQPWESLQDKAEKTKRVCGRLVVIGPRGIRTVLGE